MKPLSDRAIARLRSVAALPDLAGTRYELRRELGRGGMGVVYLARDTELQRDVALKVLHLDDRSPELRCRMLAEARTLAHLEHPNIVPVYDIGELPDTRIFYVMKHVAGVRLDGCAERSLPERLRLFAKLCDAVSYAHSKGVVHRDLKPANIMLGEFGEVLVMDWGLAKQLNVEEPGAVLGTERYMAPEQARGDAKVDHRADIFALGRILEDLSAPDVAKQLRSIIQKASAADPQHRYPDAAALSQDVLRFLDGLPVEAHRENWLESLIRYAKRNRTLLLLIVSYMIMRFAVLFWSRR